MPQAIGPDEKARIERNTAEAFKHFMSLHNSNIMKMEKKPDSTSYFYKIGGMIQEAFVEFYLTAGWKAAEWLPDGSFKLTR